MCVSPTRDAILELLRECRVDVLDGFVDFGGALVTDGHAMDAGISEGKLHCLLPVFNADRVFGNHTIPRTRSLQRTPIAAR